MRSDCRQTRFLLPVLAQSLPLPQGNYFPVPNTGVNLPVNNYAFHFLRQSKQKVRIRIAGDRSIEGERTVIRHHSVEVTVMLDAAAELQRVAANLPVDNVINGEDVAIVLHSTRHIAQ
jgi:hypothetical protein